MATYGYRELKHHPKTLLAMTSLMPDEFESLLPTFKANPTRVAMRGTNCNEPHCIALEGIVGQATSCKIYEQRSSTCREFTVSWEDRKHNEICDKARARYGVRTFVLS